MTTPICNNSLIVSSQSLIDVSASNHKILTIPTLAPQGMSRAKDILPFLPFSRTTLHEWSRDGRFPKSIRLSPTIVAWKNSEVLDWLNKHTSNTSTNIRTSGGRNEGR
ncbi:MULTISPECIES: helix-turn-helix transcriptional regulator [Psychrobacter]|uniref:AlpA family phage regulatory protein n=1 Tax=Psychrobacter communis TaxID=2762238 RepID=A0ABR8RJ45_9GAMM|nr:AlpA family phage regulatory protein [Psychrobacter communis]MBD7947837.1 AlpA family phage regulatory protein [Psychrobacter communis]